MLPFVVVVAASALATCEVWCNNACSDLNGNVAMECGTCAAPTICRPGEPGFAADGSRFVEGERSRNDGHSLNPDAPPAQTTMAGPKNSHGMPTAMPTEFEEEWTVCSSHACTQHVHVHVHMPTATPAEFEEEWTGVLV